MLDKAGDGGELGDGDALEVNDGARLFNVPSVFPGAGDVAFMHCLFVLEDVVFHESVFGREPKDGSDVEFPEVLNVDWPASLVCSVVVARVYLVDL